ncbi:hypothetical protein [Haladaptatus halobius]|uniref:hypothetical protein n=1 Tax=Haladaptatus halobius TaxID=2884875 RepID=UPI001D0BD0AD|nr:hypothetical protein [Haladaptatus halobius]
MTRSGEHFTTDKSVAEKSLAWTGDDSSRRPAYSGREVSMAVSVSAVVTAWRLRCPVRTVGL